MSTDITSELSVNIPVAKPFPAVWDRVLVKMMYQCLVTVNDADSQGFLVWGVVYGLPCLGCFHLSADMIYPVAVVGTDRGGFSYNITVT